MGAEIVSRITVIAVGVEKYENMRPLYGPSSDIGNLYNLFIENDETSLFDKSQFLAVLNPSFNDLRDCINTYVLGRSAVGDILLFYFSGHGVPLGTSDFGFCVTDTMPHPSQNITLPLTVLKISDLLNSLSQVGVIPVIVIDACYSGQAGSAIIAPNDAVATIKREIVGSSASSFALLCSCYPLQTTIDSSYGGVFSNLLFDVLGNGLVGGKPLISLQDVFQPLRTTIEQSVYDAIPMLFLGETLPDLPLVKNAASARSQQSYSFVGHLSSVITALWDNGNQKALSPNEIRDICGNGAYGNHQKLSLEPWNLVENVPGSKKRRLTERGISFVKNELSIPRTISKNLFTEKWEPAIGTTQIKISDVDV